MDEIRELNRRLDRLERRTRAYQRLLILLAAIGCGTLLMAQVRTPASREPVRIPEAARPTAQIPQEGKIRAEAFILTDSKGEERASLVTDGNGSVFLVLFDKNGRPRADLQVNNYGPSLNFYDPSAKTRVVLGSTPLVASHVSSGGIIEKNTPSSIVLFDANGQLVWRTP
jgi:hypothetical protein